MRRCRTAVVWDERYLWHDTGTHPRVGDSRWIEPSQFTEHSEAKRRFWSLLEVSGLLSELTVLKPRLATAEEIARVHDQTYVGQIATASAGVGGDAGENTPFRGGSYDVACLAAGGAITAVDAVLTGLVDNAYALVRPPGHHAEAARGRGFCIFGNCAIAVRHALDDPRIERVAVVDWDVHHGNGTQDAFYAEAEVLTVSVHQDNQYPPGRGSRSENGTGGGQGAALNVPLPPGSGVGAYVHAFVEVVIPALRLHRPDLIVVASGFDASAYDPLGRMIVHSDGFRELTSLLLEAAADLAAGRMVLVHEGGYSAIYSPFCGLAVLETLAGRRTPAVDPFLPALKAIGGQDLEPHQRAEIARAAKLVDHVPRR